MKIKHDNMDKMPSTQQVLSTHPLPFFLSSNRFSKSEQLSGVSIEVVWASSQRPDAEADHLPSSGIASLTQLRAYLRKAWLCSVPMLNTSYKPEMMKYDYTSSHRPWGLLREMRH